MTSQSRKNANKLRDFVSVKDFGAVGDGVTDDTAAINAAISRLQTKGGGHLYFPSGTYNVSEAIDLSAIDNLWIDGSGQDNTIIVTSHASAPVLYSNADRKYRKFSNFTISSSVTRTSGAFIDLLVERRSIIEDLKLTGWFDGINVRGFEETEIRRCKIVNPSGYGAAISAGTFGLFGSGANLHLIGCFLRGNDDITQNAPTGSLGLRIFDCDAVYGIDMDIGGFIDGDMSVNASVRADNFFFSQCYFDATRDGHCITVMGAGAKSRWEFSGCWIGSGGTLAGGSNSACGLFLADQGGYNGIQFTGCRFHLSKGSGVSQGRAGAIQFTGCMFEGNGTGLSGNQYGFNYTPGAAVGPGPLLTGCYFTGNTPKGVRTTTNAREVVLSGCVFDNGADITEGTAVLVSVFDKTSNTYASAHPLPISPGHNYAIVTGTTNFSAISATYAGHNLTLKFNGVVTVVDGAGNLHMPSNFTTAAGSTLTLICDGAEWWEVSRSNT